MSFRLSTGLSAIGLSIAWFIAANIPVQANTLATKQPAAVSTWTVTVSPEQKQRLEPDEALASINAWRQSQDLPVFHFNPVLIETALSYSADMAARDMISHHGRDGSDIAARLRQQGYDPFFAAENLSAGQRDFNEAFHAWLDSPVHRKALLSPKADEIGIAVFYDPNTHYKTFWVMILATPF